MSRVKDLARALRSAGRSLPRAWMAAWPTLIAAVVVTAVLAQAGWLEARSPRRWAAAVVLGIAVVGMQVNLYQRDPRGAAGEAGGGQVWTFLRLCVAGLLVVAFLGVLAMLCAVVILSVDLAVASTSGGFSVSQVATWNEPSSGGAKLVLRATDFGVALFMTWAATRIALAAAATAAQGRLSVLSSWPMTKGRLVVIATSRFAVAGGALALISAARLVAERAGGGAAATAAIFFGLWLPLDAALLAYFFRTRTQSA